MLDLIIKNGKCYIDKNLNEVDIGIQNSKIVKILLLHLHLCREALCLLICKLFYSYCNIITNDISTFSNNVRSYY